MIWHNTPIRQNSTSKRFALATKTRSKLGYNLVANSLFLTFKQTCSQFCYNACFQFTGVPKVSVEKTLQLRSESKCELCGETDGLSVYELPASPNNSTEECILICNTCSTQIENPDAADANHWRCLNDSMWSEVPAVQVMAWRILTRLNAEAWPRDMLDMLYLDDETLAWAKAGIDAASDESISHKDSNGSTLTAGDTVTLIKDLTVKGANFTAKRGTAVRGISLVADNPEHIEGRINGQQIVILTKFVKKSN